MHSNPGVLLRLFPSPGRRSYGDVQPVENRNIDRNALSVSQDFIGFNRLEIIDFTDDTD